MCAHNTWINEIENEYDKEDIYNMDGCGLFPLVPRPINRQLAEENVQDDFSNWEIKNSLMLSKQQIVTYRISNHKSWMTKAMFENYIRKISRMQSQERR